MQVRFYNSLTNKIEDFQPIKANEVSIYVCGPTVYNDIHIGNARPVVFFDLVARFFKSLGYQVKLVTNFTDVDDKIIQKALKEGVSEQVIANRYIQAFMDIYNQLNCLPAYKMPRVTETIPEITAFIAELLAKGAAYQIGNDVYFRVQADDEYGILSNQRLADLNAGSRIDVDSNKENPADFLLWKLTDDAGIKWDSPFGCGRPGWHTECVVMIQDIFHGMIDIHGGGNDLKFPHHENEIAQAHANYQHNIANYWLHNARVDLDGIKMSKSLGNVVLMKDLLQQVDANVVRLLILSNHYRQPINFKEELLGQAKTEWEKLANSYLKLYRALELANAIFADQALSNHPTMTDFMNALADDFNTSNALTILMQTIKDANIALRAKADSVVLKQYWQLINQMFTIFGFNPAIKPLSTDEKTLVLAWQDARNAKNFALADQYRAEITQKGIML